MKNKFSNNYLFKSEVILFNKRNLKMNYKIFSVKIIGYSKIPSIVLLKIFRKIKILILNNNHLKK